MGLHDKEAADRDKGAAELGAAWDRYGASLGNKGSQARTGFGGGGGSSGCFPAHAEVQTPTGTVYIANLKVGDVVSTFDPSGSVLRSQPVLKIKKYKVGSVIQLGFSNGENLRLTKSHCMLTDKGYVIAKELQVGSVLKTSDGSCRVSTIHNVVEDGPVFNLVTRGEHNFIVHGCIAHNFSHFRILRSLWWKLISAHVAGPEKRIVNPVKITV